MPGAAGAGPNKLGCWVPACVLPKIFVCGCVVVDENGGVVPAGLGPNKLPNVFVCGAGCVPGCCCCCCWLVLPPNMPPPVPPNILVPLEAG